MGVQHKGRPKAPVCLHCATRLRKHARYTLHGDYGDGFFCGVACGHAWAVAELNGHHGQMLSLFQVEAPTPAMEDTSCN